MYAARRRGYCFVDCRIEAVDSQVNAALKSQVIHASEADIARCSERPFCRGVCSLFDGDKCQATIRELNSSCLRCAKFIPCKCRHPCSCDSQPRCVFPECAPNKEVAFDVDE